MKYTGKIFKIEKAGKTVKFHSKQLEKLLKANKYVYLCISMNSIRVKPVFFETGYYLGVYFVFGSSLFEPFLGVLSEL